MARSVGISGLAVTTATVGGYLVWSGIRDVPTLDGLRQLLSGQTPAARPAARTPVVFTGGPSQAAAGPPGVLAVGSVGSGPNAAIARAALRYLGVPYRWGGTDPATGLDCSGLVYRTLNDAGVKVSRLTSMGFRTWRGAQTIPRTSCAAGDLVCFVGHIGIALDATRMVEAPRPGRVVRVAPIDGTGLPGLTIRRITTPSTVQV